MDRQKELAKLIRSQPEATFLEKAGAFLHTLSVIFLPALHDPLYRQRYLECLEALQANPNPKSE